MRAHTLLKRIRSMFSPEPEKERLFVEPTTVEESPLFLNIPHCFGYLSTLSNETAIPEECLVCKKMLECRYPSS